MKYRTSSVEIRLSVSILSDEDLRYNVIEKISKHLQIK